MIKNKMLFFSLSILIFTTACSKISSKESEVIYTYSEVIEKLSETTTIINKFDKTKITDEKKLKNLYL